MPGEFWALAGGPERGEVGSIPGRGCEAAPWGLAAGGPGAQGRAAASPRLTAVTPALVTRTFLPFNELSAPSNAELTKGTPSTLLFGGVGGWKGG